MTIQLKNFLVAGATALTLAVSGSAFAETTLRLSTLFKPGSEGAVAAEDFAQRVNAATEGRIKVNVYPASQLGDWAGVHAQLMQGAVDMAIQPLSTSFDPRLAVSWFPYMAATYDAAEEAYSQGGYVHTIVDELIAPQNLKLMGVFGSGMGGAGFAKAVKEPANPDVNKGLKIRVWPGGTTHRHLMERFGYNVATVPWAELYTAMQTGVVDGQIGGTPEMALANFKDITNTWVQYNDHFEVSWFVMNRPRFENLPEKDRNLILKVAQDITTERFEAVRKSDAEQLQLMRDAGINVVTFSDKELENFAAVAREDVWPIIGKELGDEVMTKLKAAVGE